MPTAQSRATKNLSPEIPHLSKGEVRDLRSDMYEAFSLLEQDSDSITGYISTALGHAIRSVERAIGAAIAGDAALVLAFGSNPENVSAASLNAAAANTYFKSINLKLQTAGGSMHGWANFQPVITPAVTATDVDIVAPTVTKYATLSETPEFDAGFLALRVIFDTDAGATKTYQAGDVVTVTIDVSGISLLAGVANFVKTFNIVA